MLTEESANEILLAKLNDGWLEGHIADRFVIQSTELSPRQDYWILTANSEAYVLRGDFSKCYVGVSAYLVNTQTGDIEIVGNLVDAEEYLQDRYDEKEAAGKQYVLSSGYRSKDNQVIIRLHQLLGCTLADARELMSGSKKNWLRGKKRCLLKAQYLFERQNINSEIILEQDADELPSFSDSHEFWEDIQKLMQMRAQA